MSNITFTVDGITYSPSESNAPQVYKELRRYHKMQVSGSLKLQIVDRDGTVIDVKVDPSLLLLPQLEKAAGKRCKFIVNGDRVGARSTMINMDLEEGDIIDNISM